MKNSASLFIALLIVVPACSATKSGGDTTHGSGGSSSSGTTSSGVGAGGSTTTVDANAVEAACNLEVDAMFAMPCASTQITESQALAECLSEALGAPAGCTQQVVDLDTCLGQGGYTCSNGAPVANATCVAQTTALQACVMAAPCEAYCARETQEGCAPSGCLAACQAQQAMLGNCAGYYGGLLTCWSGVLTCSGGAPTTTGCDDQIGATGWCLSTLGVSYQAQTDDCTGFCWAAEALGCGAGCTTDCEPKLQGTCGGEYRSVLDCAVDVTGLSLACEAGVPTPGASCANQVQSYESCLMMGP